MRPRNRAIGSFLTLVFCSSLPASALTWNTAGPTNVWTLGTGNGNWDAVAEWTEPNAAAFTTAVGETVTVTGIVTPTATTVGDNGGNWIFNGTGGIASGTLTKNGAGLVTLSNTGPNAFASTVVNAGTLEVTGAANALLNGVAVNSPGTLLLNVAGAANIIYDNAISGNGALKVAARGPAAGNTSTLSGALSSFTGTIDILPSATGGGKVNLTNASQLNVPNTLSLIRVQNGATLQLNTGLTYLSGLELYGGTIAEAFGQARVENNTIYAGNVKLKAGTSVGTNNGTGTFSGVISDEGNAFGLTKQGPGVTALTGENTYTGTTTIAAGALQIGNNGTTGSIVPTSPVILSTATSALNINHSNDVVFPNVVSGIGQPIASNPAGLTKNGAGALTLSAQSTFTGGFRHNAGTIVLAADSVSAAGAVLSGPLGAGIADFRAGTIRAVDATPRVIGNQLSYSATLIFGSATTGNLEFTGAVGMGDAAKNFTVNNAITKFTGVLSSGATVANAFGKDGPGVLVLGGANTFPKNFTVTAGTLNLANPLALQFSTLTTITNGTVFDASVTPAAFTLGGLAGAGNILLANNAAVPAPVNLSLGNNSLAAAHTGILSGTGGVTKVGTAVQTLSGLNTYTGPTTLSAGILAVGLIGNGGVASGIGQSTSASGNLVFAGGTLRYTGADTSTDRGFTINPGTVGGVDVANATANLTLGGVGDGLNGGLTKSGTGRLTLAGTNFYTGPTTVSAGTLNLTGSLTSAVSVASGATLTGNGSTGFPITFQGGSTLLVGATPLTSSGVSAIVSPVNVIVAAPPGSPGSHTVDVLKYGGGLVDGLGNFSASLYRSGVIANDSPNTKLTLTYLSESKVWNTLSGVWDVNGPTSPWTGGTDGKFFQGDAVTFPDIASDSTITLSSVLAPSGFTISNSANTYTFAGTGSIGGTAGLVKSGAGTALISTANTFSGQTLVNAGLLRAGSAAALGLGGVGNETIVSGGGAFDINGVSMNTGITPESFRVSGDGVGGLGAVVNNGAAQQNAFSQMVLTGDTRFGGTGRFDFRVIAGAPTPFLDLAGHTLTKVGANQFSLVGTVIGEGNIVVDTGNLSIEAGSTLTGAGTVTVHSTGILGVYANTPSTNFTRPIIVNSGTLQNTGNNAALDCPISLQPAATFAGTTTTTLNGVISEVPGTPGVLTKIGAGTFVLTGANTYTGGTLLNDGVVQISQGGALGTGAVTQTGGRFLLGNGTDVTFSRPITINGGGGVTGLGIIYATANNATVTSPITINGGVAAGGHFSGPAGVNFLNLQGAVTSTVPLVLRDGNMLMAGGGSAASMQLTGLLKIGANNGAPSDAVITIGASNPGTVDLNGFNQTFAGIIKGANAATITNNGAAPATLTVNDAVGSTYAGVITAGTGGALSLVKAGAGTMVLSGANTYTGSTSVNAGTLSLAAANLSDTAAVKLLSGTVLNLAHNQTDMVKEFYIDNVKQDSGKWGRINSIAELGAAHESALITGDGLLQVTVGVNVAYTSWAQNKGLSAGNNTTVANPDGDLLNNLGEFAFDGSPLSASGDGKIRVRVGIVNGQKVLTLTLPMRTDTTFLPDSPTATELISNPVDGIVYHVQGSDELSTFGLKVTEVTGPDLTAIQAGLPTPLTTGWSYRTFRTPGIVTDPANPRDFLRAKVVEQ